MVFLRVYSICYKDVHLQLHDAKCIIRLHDGDTESDENHSEVIQTTVKIRHKYLFFVSNLLNLILTE